MQVPCPHVENNVHFCSQYAAKGGGVEGAHAAICQQLHSLSTGFRGKQLRNKINLLIQIVSLKNNNVREKKSEGMAKIFFLCLLPLNQFSCTYSEVLDTRATLAASLVEDQGGDKTSIFQKTFQVLLNPRLQG